MQDLRNALALGNYHGSLDSNRHCPVTTCRRKGVWSILTWLSDLSSHLQHLIDTIFTRTLRTSDKGMFMSLLLPSSSSIFEGEVAKYIEAIPTSPEKCFSHVVQTKDPDANLLYGPSIQLRSACTPLPRQAASSRMARGSWALLART
jgi:hypothetical protein